MAWFCRVLAPCVVFVSCMYVFAVASSAEGYLRRYDGDVPGGATGGLFKALTVFAWVCDCLCAFHFLLCFFTASPSPKCKV